MRILTIGFLVFVCWSAFSTFLYVCKIKGLCNEKETTLVSSLTENDSLTVNDSVTENDSVTVNDSVTDALDAKPELVPENLVIYFAFDKSSFTADPSITGYYDKSMAWILRNSSAGIHITGHTDAKGSDEYNKALGYRRAQSVQNYFESRGFPSDRITTDSKGEQEPVENNNTDEGRAKNRRASITIKY